MNGTASRLVRFSIALLGLVTLGWVLAGNAAKPAPQRVPVSTDWSHSHLIFSRGATPARTQHVQEDPRYWQQILRQIPRLTPERTALGGSMPTAQVRAPRQGKMHRDWSENLGSGGGAGAGNFPAKFSFDSTTADCANDYVAFSTGLQSSASQADIVAFHNLYSGCPTGAVPSVLWAYSTSPVTPVKVLTSPGLSLDGSQIAFVQTSGPLSQLVLLKWAASTTQSVTAPLVLTPVVPGAYRGCTAPCMTKFDLAADDRTSSVFIDYGGDIAWVGDAKGFLHKITGVFLGTPTESGAPWPLNVTGGQPLTSPVFDHVTANVFVGAKNGFLYRINSTTAALIRAAQLDHSTGLAAGPVVDSGRGTVYVAASNDGSGACLNGVTVVDCAAVFQLSTSFASNNHGSKVVVGISTLHPAAPKTMYNGFFDSTYLNSVNGTGNLYVCGNTGSTATLYQVPVNAGAFGTPVTVSVLDRTQNQPCSPVTALANPNTAGGASERVFVSTQADAWPFNCVSVPPGGCAMNFVVTQWQPSTAYAIGEQVLVRSTGNPNVLFIQTVIHAGTSGTSTPAWGFAPDLATSDPPGFGPTAVGWLNQGRIDQTPLASWTANTVFGVIGQRILDSHNDVQLVNIAGTSGATEPIWSNNPGTATADNGVQWIEGGSIPTFAIPASGGTSGIVVDNTVGSGTLAGASQIYFTTLGNQTCTTSGGTGGCAVQASQPALQ